MSDNDSGAETVNESFNDMFEVLEGQYLDAQGSGMNQAPEYFSAQQQYSIARTGESTASQTWQLVPKISTNPEGSTNGSNSVHSYDPKALDSLFEEGAGTASTSISAEPCENLQHSKAQEQNNLQSKKQQNSATNEPQTTTTQPWRDLNTGSHQNRPGPSHFYHPGPPPVSRMLEVSNLVSANRHSGTQRPRSPSGPDPLGRRTVSTPRRPADNRHRAANAIHHRSSPASRNTSEHRRSITSLPNAHTIQALPMRAAGPISRNQDVSDQALGSRRLSRPPQYIDGFLQPLQPGLLEPMYDQSHRHPPSMSQSSMSSSPSRRSAPTPSTPIETLVEEFLRQREASCCHERAGASTVGYPCLEGECRKRSGTHKQWRRHRDYKWPIVLNWCNLCRKVIDKRIMEHLTGPHRVDKSAVAGCSFKIDYNPANWSVRCTHVGCNEIFTNWRNQALESFHDHVFDVHVAPGIPLAEQPLQEDRHSQGGPPDEDSNGNPGMQGDVYQGLPYYPTQGTKSGNPQGSYFWPSHNAPGGRYLACNVVDDMSDGDEPPRGRSRYRRSSELREARPILVLRRSEADDDYGFEMTALFMRGGLTEGYTIQDAVTDTMEDAWAGQIDDTVLESLAFMMEEEQGLIVENSIARVDDSASHPTCQTRSLDVDDPSPNTSSPESTVMEIEEGNIADSASLEDTHRSFILRSVVAKRWGLECPFLSISSRFMVLGKVMHALEMAETSQRPPPCDQLNRPPSHDSNFATYIELMSVVDRVKLQLPTRRLFERAQQKHDGVQIGRDQKLNLRKRGTRVVGRASAWQ